MSQKMTSVIIASRNEPQLKRTCEALYESAERKIEIIVINDGGDKVIDIPPQTHLIYNPKPMGRRISINAAARIAKGEHLFVLDGHCSMSKGWDVKMVEASEDNTIVMCTIQDMKADTWEHFGGKYSYVYLNKNLEEKWWGKPEPWPAISETMCFTGCAWMIPKDYFWELGGYDESLGEYGWDGPEWTMRVWLNEIHPGKLKLRSDVICGHVFGTNVSNKLYPANTIGHAAYYKKMKDEWGDRLDILWDRFPDVPGHVKQDIAPNYTKTVFATTIRKVDEVEERDNKTGKLISKKKLHYKPYIHKHDGSKTPEEIVEEMSPKITEVEREEVLV